MHAFDVEYVLVNGEKIIRHREYTAPTLHDAVHKQQQEFFGDGEAEHVTMYKEDESEAFVLLKRGVAYYRVRPSENATNGGGVR